MELKKFLRMYRNVSRKECVKFLAGIYYDPVYDFHVFEGIVKNLDRRREREKIEGRQHVKASPLVQVLSVHVQSDKVDENKPLAIYGRIYGELHDDIIDRNMITHDLFNRKFDDPEILGPTGLLTLIGPDDYCCPSNACMPLHQTRIVVDVYDGADNAAFAQGSFFVEETTEDDYEQVKEKVVTGTRGSLTVLYVAMPFAILCRVEVIFYQKKSDEDKEKRRIVNVNGKIVARYGHTYGSYASEECMLFEKQSDEFEQVAIDQPKTIKQSRYWISVPAYSSLIIDLDLSEFDTKRKIIKETVELKSSSVSEFVLDKFVIHVNVAWFPVSQYLVVPKKESTVELEDESCDDQLSSSICNRWIVRRSETKLLPSKLMEVYSVFIGRENFKALRLFGTIEVSNGDHAYHIFNRQAKNAMELPGDCKTALVLDGSRIYDDDDPFVLKFALKDVEGHISIKGYADWKNQYRVTFPYYDKQLCSVIPGEHGFAAVHYSIFSTAVQAQIEVCYKLKKGDSDVCPLVYGTLVAQYSNYDYSTRFKRDYYRCVLFERIREDPLWADTDGRIPLSRSIVVVPSSSSLIVEVDLSIIDPSSGVFVQSLSGTLEIEIGASSMSLETEDRLVNINLKWSDGE